MKNSNLNNEYLDYEIDLIEVVRTIYSSKKLIILITLASALLAFIYLAQKEVQYQSTVIIELGSYDLLSGERKIVEPVPSLIKKLKINQISKQLHVLNFNSIEDHFLKINYTSPSPELNENAIKEAIKFAQESHVEILDNILNSFSEKIMSIDNEIEFLNNSIESQQESKKLNAINLIKALDKEIEFLKNSVESQKESKKLNAINAIKALDNEIEFLKNSLESQKESKKLNAINAIKALDHEIPALEAKIKFLLKLIPDEERNLRLLQSDNSALLLRASSSPTLQQIIYSYNEQTINLKNQIQNLQQEKEALEMQVKSIEKGEFISGELFKLQQEKEALEMQVKSIEKGEFISGELFKLQQEKEALEMQVKSIEKGEFISGELFKLQQEKEALEMQIKLVKDQKSTPQPIRELKTSEIKPKQLLTILIFTILGFIFSVFIVFIRQAFLKEQN
ncbi:Wzz/FepE/Etk N-terminal domain-containing protein [Candidatus Thioglobus sp.]|nr:Wzz/FepE/Etk N-terminal domain-containing protein [Candidatus Thioglobus sp.]